MTTLSPALLSSAPTCGTLVTADGRTLPLRNTRLVVRAAGGFAQVRLVQTFANPHEEPLHVRYQLPLPADAAIGGFEFRLGTQRVIGEIDRRSSARERFEQAIASGRTAALLEQDRSSLFTQELGNLPPGAEVEATIDVDQPLQWLDGSWQWRFPTTVAPRYLGADRRVADAARLAVDVAEPRQSSVPPRCELDLVIADALPIGSAPQSSSHPLQTNEVAGGSAIHFAAAGGRVAMDRDIVVDWSVAATRVGVTLHTVRPADGPLAGQAFGLLTLVPPTNATMAPRLSRDLIVLLDISGSMQGAPLAQAQAVATALVDSLDGEDRLELIAFASEAKHWRNGPRAATADNRAAALQWLRSLRAGGGTEMHTAILDALAATRGGVQRQVVVVTDGLIGFEQEIVAAIQNGLPAHSRVHVVGVGSATNRTLTRGASRAGRGLEILIGVHEAPTAAAARLLARTSAPLLDELELAGSLVRDRAPRAVPDLFAGAPTRLLLRLDPNGGTLHVRGHGATGAFLFTLELPPLAVGGDPMIARCYAREAVEDLEVDLAAGAAAATIEARIEALGLQHRIATRLTSWVAIAATATVDPQAPQRRHLVPHELPNGMAIDQLGLRSAGRARPNAAPSMADACSVFSMPMSSVPEATRSAGLQAKETTDHDDQEQVAPPPKAKKSLLSRLFGSAGGGTGGDERKPEPTAAPGPGPRATLRLRGTGEWLLELTGLAAWQGHDRVVVVLDDGSEHELRVDRARTTTAGPLAAGAIVRLALAALPGASLPTGVPVRLRIVIAGATLDVPIA